MHTVLATLRQLEMSKNHYELTLMLVLANVFSSAVIRGASTQLRTAMEHVAGKAEELTKAKIKDDPPHHLGNVKCGASQNLRIGTPRSTPRMGKHRVTNEQNNVT